MNIIISIGAMIFVYLLLHLFTDWEQSRENFDKTGDDSVLVPLFDWRTLVAFSVGIIVYIIR